MNWLTRFFVYLPILDRKKDGRLLQRYQFYLAQQGQTLSDAHELLDSLIERDYDLYAATNGITVIQTASGSIRSGSLFQPSLYLRAIANAKA